MKQFELHDKVKAFEFIFRLYNFLALKSEIIGQFSYDAPTLYSHVMGTNSKTNTSSKTGRGCSGGSHQGLRQGSRQGSQTAPNQCALAERHVEAIQTEGYMLLPSEGAKQSTIAKAVQHGHVVAMKLLHGLGATNELEILQDLQTFDSHQNHTIRLLHVIHSDSTPGDILVMPWQSPLDSFLTGGSHMIVSLQDQLLEGVRFLHEHGIAHLDLKPGNVLVGYVDASSLLPRLSIIDYGISIRVEGEETLVEGYRGTPGWSAPEVGTEYETPKEYSAI